MLTWSIFPWNIPKIHSVDLGELYHATVGNRFHFTMLRCRADDSFWFIWKALCLYFRLWCDIKLTVLTILIPKSLRTKKVTTFLMIYLRKWRNPKGRKKHLISDHEVYFRGCSVFCELDGGLCHLWRLWRCICAHETYQTARKNEGKFGGKTCRWSSQSLESCDTKRKSRFLRRDQIGYGRILASCKAMMGWLRLGTLPVGAPSCAQLFLVKQSWFPFWSRKSSGKK